MNLTNEQTAVIRDCCRDQASFDKVIRIIEEATDSKKGMRQVLSVDDNEHVGMLIKASLEPIQCEVTCVLNGQDALTQIYNKKWDLIFLDIMLPDIDGGEVLNKIRETDNNQNTPVIYVTGLVKPEEESRLPNRKEKYIGKPFTAEKVRSVTRELLG